MPDDAKQAWNDVGQRFSSLGKRLADSYRERGDADASAETQRKLEDAARDLGNQLERAFGSLESTVRDPEARADLQQAVNAVGDAITLTVREAGQAIKGRSGSEEDPPRPDGSEPSA